MSVPTKLGAFGLVLAAALAAGLAVGAAAGPIDIGGDTQHSPAHDEPLEDDTHD